MLRALRKRCLTFRRLTACGVSSKRNPALAALCRRNSAAGRCNLNRCFSSETKSSIGQDAGGVGQSAHNLTRSSSALHPSSRSGLSDISMHDASNGRDRGWDLSHQLNLFHFGADGSFAQRTMSLSTILHKLDIAPSTSFLRKVRSTQIQKLVCEGTTIFVTLGDVRAFISAEQVFLFGTERVLIKEQANELEWALGSNHTKRIRDEYADESRGRATELPYEMRALETMLAAVADVHEARLGVLAPVIGAMLTKLEGEGTVAVGIVQSAEREEVLLQKLLPLTKATETFRLAVQETRDALSQLLQCEFELAQMQLSWRRDNDQDHPTKEEAYYLSQRTRQVLATTER